MMTALLLSCVPEFEHPISREGKATVDKELIGKWEVKDGKIVKVNFIEKKGGLLNIHVVGQSQSDQSEEATVYKGYSTNVNELKFLCVQDVNGNGNYFILNYKMVQDKLYIHHLSEEKIAKLIKDGKLKGVIPKPDGGNVKVTSSREELRRVIAKEGLNAFCDVNDNNDVLIFTRVKKETKERGKNKEAKTTAGRALSDKTIYKQLEQNVDLSMLNKDMSFADAIEEVKRAVQPGVQIVVVWRDLEEKGKISRSTRINMDDIAGVHLKTAMQLLLSSVSSDLASISYAVNNGVIVIATKRSLPHILETRTYEVPDILSQPADYRSSNDVSPAR